MDSNETTIVQCGGGWPTNIGNAFIDLGSIYVLNKASEKSKIILLSNLPRSFLSRVAISKSLLSRVFQSILSKIYNSATANNISNVFDVRGLVKADYLVFSGCMLTSSWFRRGFPDQLLKKDTKIIIHGGGGLHIRGKKLKRLVIF